MIMISTEGRHALVASATFFAALSCARTPSPSLDPMLAAPVCETTPMKPLGRVARIPEGVASSNRGTLTGSLFSEKLETRCQGLELVLYLPPAVVPALTLSATLMNTVDSRSTVLRLVAIKSVFAAFSSTETAHHSKL